MSVPSLIPPPTSTHSKINPNKPPIQHTSFLKKQPAFCFLTSVLYHSNCSKMIKLLIFLLKTNPDRTAVRAVFQNPFSSSSYRGVIIKYSIVRLLHRFCWLFHIVYDVWTGTPYQCRCAGCSRLFAGITIPVLIKIHRTMSRMLVSVRMMESWCSNYTIVLRFGFVS